VNARSAPARVSEAHLTDQIPNFWRRCWTTFATPTLPCPIEAKTLRCQATTVSGLRMSGADRQSFHKRESQTHRTRSAQPRRSL